MVKKQQRIYFLNWFLMGGATQWLEDPSIKAVVTSNILPLSLHSLTSKNYLRQGTWRYSGIPPLPVFNTSTHKQEKETFFISKQGSPVATAGLDLHTETRLASISRDPLPPEF